MKPRSFSSLLSERAKIWMLQALQVMQASDFFDTVNRAFLLPHTGHAPCPMRLSLALMRLVGGAQVRGECCSHAGRRFTRVSGVAGVFRHVIQHFTQRDGCRVHFVVSEGHYVRVCVRSSGLVVQFVHFSVFQVVPTP